LFIGERYEDAFYAKIDTHNEKKRRRKWIGERFGISFESFQQICSESEKGKFITANVKMTI